MERKTATGGLDANNSTANGENSQLFDTDPVEKAMLKFRRKGRVYKIITMETPLEELEAFFRGGKRRDDDDAGVRENGEDGSGSRSDDIRQAEPQDFAVVTDPERRFVLGVVTKADLEEFVKRRPLLS